MEPEGDNGISFNWCTWKDLQRVGNGTKEMENRGGAETIQTKIGQNTEKGPEDLKRLANTYTLVKNPQIMLVKRAID